MDGTPLDFTYWNAGEPNQWLGKEEDFVYIESGKWNDAEWNGGSGTSICKKALYQWYNMNTFP